MNKHVFDKKRWGEMSIFDQMGNIGAEVGRALSAKKMNDKASLEGAVYRGTDLFNATIESLVAKKSKCYYEVLIAREQFHEAVFTDKEDPKLDDYFMQFAFAARKDR